jgi:hypothetical protein
VPYLIKWGFKMREKTHSKDPEYLVLKELAEKLRCSEKRIYVALQKNAKDPFPVRARKFGRQRLFAVKDVNEYLESL